MIAFYSQWNPNVIKQKYLFAFGTQYITITQLKLTKTLEVFMENS